MKRGRFVTKLVVTALAFAMLAILSLPAQAYPVVDIYKHPKSFTETAGVRFLASFRMIYVEGGSFTLGWQIDDQYSSPPHSPFDTAPLDATVSDFYIAETETTSQLWDAVMGNAASVSQSPKSTVNFYEVNRFLGRLYVLTGKVYRLATEAEWEFAAKGGNPGKALGHHDFLFSGSNIEAKVAVTGSASTTVKGKEPNVLGIYDMSGNLEEWVWNPWNSTIVGGDDPIGVNSPVHAQRTRRGGAYQGEPYSRFSTARQIRSIDGSDPLLGFRIALSADQQSCPWERVGLPKPFDIRHPVIDDRYEPNTYRDQRLVTNDANVWDGDFVGIFGGATMKLWDTGEAVLIPHGVFGDGTPIYGQWYTTLNVALVIVPEDDHDDWQPNPHDGVRRLTVTYTFMDPDLISVQNDRATVFASPFGKLARKNEAQYMAALTPTGAHQGNYVSIQKPDLKTPPTPTELLAPGVGPVAVNHIKWDMTQMNDGGDIEPAARGKDSRIIDGLENCWWMGYGAGGEHTYRKDIDIDTFRFGVYSPAFGAISQTPFGPAWYMNIIARGDWYTVNDVLLVVLCSPKQHYIYLLAPDAQWQTRNDAQDPANTTEIYTKENAESTAAKYVLARNALMSPATYPFRHLSLQNQERGDQRLFFQWPTHEVYMYPDEIPAAGTNSIFPSTFRMPIDQVAACPGIPVLNPNGTASGTWETCGGTYYTCSCPIYPHGRGTEVAIPLVELNFPVPEFGKSNNRAARAVTVVTPGVAATTTTTPFNPSVTADTTTNPSGGAFARNTNYTITITIYPKTGYNFPAGSSTAVDGLRVKVNGIDATVNARPTTGNVRARTVTVVLNSGIGLNVVTNVALTMQDPSAQSTNNDAARLMTVSSVSGTSPNVTVTAAATTTAGAVSSTPWTIAPATTSAVAADAAFDVDTEYTLTFTLTPGSTCAFPIALAGLDVTVNGITATVIGATGTAPNSGLAPNRTLQVTFPPTGFAYEVCDIDINMPFPTGGYINNDAARTLVAASGDATVNPSDVTFDPPVAENETFTAGTEYGMTFTFSPGAGRYFPASLTDLNVTVNGITATVTSVAGDGGADRIATVYFPPADATPEVVAVTLEMPLPVFGRVNDAAARSIAVTSGNVSLGAIGNLPWTIPPANTSAVANNAAFARNTAYGFSFTLIPDAGYVFPATLASLSVTVSGIPAEIMSAPLGTHNRVVRVTFPSSGIGTLVSTVALTMATPATYGLNNTAARAVTVAGGSTVATTTVTNTPWTIPPASASAVANATGTITDAMRFQADTSYRFSFTLNAGSASTFPTDTGDLAVTVNGIPATVAGKVGNGEYNRALYVDFPMTTRLAQAILSDNPLSRVAGVDFNLTGWSVSSAGAGGGAIVYSVVDPGTTGAAVSGATLSVTGRGQGTLKARTEGNAYFLPAEATFTLIVSTPPYTVTFDAAGGTVAPVSATTLGSGKLALAELPVPTHGKNYFEGWFTAPVGGDPVTLDTVFDGAATVYAHWGLPVTSVKIIDAQTGAPVSAMVTMARNKTMQCAVTVNAGSDPKYANIVWSSSDTALATVTQNGLITTKNKTGTAVITARDTVSGVSCSFVLRTT